MFNFLSKDALNKLKKNLFQVIPKLISVLDGACHKAQVNPVHVYPNVLPLLSQLLPKLVETWSKDNAVDVDEKLSKFYSKLLSAVKNGLDHFLSLAPKSSGQQLLRKGGSSNAAKLAIETYFDCVLVRQYLYNIRSCLQVYLYNIFQAKLQKNFPQLNWFI